MYRGTGDFQSQWIYHFLLNASADEANECLEPTFVRVLKHVAGPFEDGSVRKQVSDGDLFMDALFSSKAIESGILCDDSQMEWDGCDLLLKRYRVQYEMPTVNQNCVGQMILLVNECELMTPNHGFGPRKGFSHRENPTFCMTKPELQKRLQSHLVQLQAAESSSSAVESNLAVSLLMGQMYSEDVTTHTHSQLTDSFVPVRNFDEPPDLQNFLISAEDQMRLDDIEEWLSTFVPAEETPPSTSHSNAVILSHLSSEVHHPSPPSLPTNHHKMLCDASVQVTFCLHDTTTTTRPVTVDVGVEVGDSLMFNTQQPIAEPEIVDGCEESYHLIAVPSSSNLPVAVPISGDLPVAVPSSFNLSFAVPTSGNLPVVVPTPGYAPPTVFPCSALLPPILVPCIQDFPLREELWSSGSSLRLSCDEEPNDLQQRDPNLEMLGQKFVSSDSSANMMVEDESPVAIPASKITSPPSSLVAIIPGHSARKIHLEESTIDPVTTSVLHCSEPERIDPVIASGTEFQFIQSTQIDYLSSQHCPIEPDFPLSPVMRLGETQCSTQSFQPVRRETTRVSSDKIGCGVENSPHVGNVSSQGTASDIRENVFIVGNVPISANVAKGGTISDDGNVPKGGNALNIGSVPNIETVGESGDTAASGYGLRGGNVASGQSISCLANVQSAGVGRIGGNSHPKSSKGNVCRSGMSFPHERNVSDNEVAVSNDKIIPSSGSVDWSSLPDVISFGSVDRAIEAEKCQNADGSTLSNTFERVSETEKREENVSVGRIVGRVWISPPRQRSHGKIDDVRNDDDEKLMNIQTRSKGEDVRTKDATMNDVPVVGTEAARRELNMSPRHILTSARCQAIPASLLVPLPLSVTRKTILANISVSSHIATASMSVANQDSSASASVSNRFASASLLVSHQMSTATSTSGPIPQTSTASSGLRINPSILTSLSQACSNLRRPVSVAGFIPSASVSVGCSNKLPPDNQPKSRTKLDLVARISGEVPLESGSTRTYRCASSKPIERENEESETDSFDEELIRSAESTKLHAEVEPSESTSTNILALDTVKNSTRTLALDTGKDSTRTLKLTTVSTHTEATKKDDNVTTKDKNEKISEKKKSLNRGKGSRLSLSQTRDPMSLFAKRDSKKLTDNRKRKLFNVDQILEGISSGNQTDSEGSDTRIDALGKQRGAIDRAPVVEKKFKGDSDGKSKKTDTKGKAGVTVKQSTDSGNLGNADRVADGTSGLRTLAREIAGKSIHLGKEETKKSTKVGSAGVANSTVVGKELSKTVSVDRTQRDSSGLRSIIDQVSMHSVKTRDVAAVGVDHVQIVPLASAVSVAEGGRESNTKTDGNCRFSEERSWRFAADKLIVEKSRNRRSSIDMFTGLTDKPNNEDMSEDITHHHPQVTCNVPEVTARQDTSDTRSICEKDIITFTETKTVVNSRDSSARNYLHPKRSALKQTVSNRVTTRDATSRDQETIENSGFFARDGSLSKSGESQASIVERLSLPTPKNSLPSHQPPRQSATPHGSDQSTPVSSGQPSSPKLNRDRIKMLLGRDKMTSDEAKAFSCSDLPENLKHWTFSYFKNWS